MKRMVNVLVALTVFCGAFMAVSPLQSASAQPLAAVSAERNCSLPYVTDVNPCGKEYLATIEVAGNPSVLKVYLGKKQLHVYKLDAHTWSVSLKKGKLYTIKVKASGSSWKKIRYSIG